jgi:hypothetical protein
MMESVEIIWKYDSRILTSYQNCLLEFKFVKNLRKKSANENKDDLVMLKTSLTSM